MKYTIELTDNQKKQMDLLCELAHRYIGFNPKLKMIETTNVEDTNEYQIGYKEGRKDGFDYCRENTELIPELKKAEYTKGYNSAINDYNGMIQWLHDCTDDFKEFMNKKYGYDIMYLTNPRVDEGVMLYDLMCDHDIAEVISKFQKWQKKKDDEESIKVGDVVKFNEKCHNYDHVKSREFLVLHIFDNGLVTLLYDNGDSGAAEISLLDKTSKHFDEVERLLDKLRGERNNG